MPRKCSVQGCKSNYKTTSDDGHVSVFRFPSEPKLKNKWVECIGKKNFEPTKSSAVCIKHFVDKFVIKEDKLLRDDGTTAIIPRQKPKLDAAAFPTIRLNNSVSIEVPKNLSTFKHRQELEFRKRKQTLLDNIRDFKQFLASYKDTRFDPFIAIEKESSVTFIKLSSESEVPRIVLSFEVVEDLSIKVSSNNVRLSNPVTTFILGRTTASCHTWSKFKSIIQSLNKFSEIEINLPSNLKIDIIGHMMGKLIDESNQDKALINKWKFLREQFLLSVSQQPRYSAETLEWAWALFDSHPGAYELIRSSNLETLPHPKHLQKLIRHREELGEVDVDVEY